MTKSIIDESEAVILNALAKKARGERFDSDVVEEAAFKIAMANLFASGMSEEQVHHQLVEREYDIRIRFSREDGLTIDLVFDGEVPA